MDDVGIFMAILSILRPKWYMFWPFGTFCGHLVYVSRFGMFVVPRKIWQPWLNG
jgi:hypothetical protein